MKNDRKELVDQLFAIREQEKIIRKQIEAIDHKERLSKVKQFEGKYYQEVESHESHVRCMFVYASDEEKCEPLTLSISYWKDNEFSWFDIQYYSYFNPNDEDSSTEWREITKEEYMQHYAQVQKRISLAIESKTTNS